MASEVTLIDDEDLEYADATIEERVALKATEIVLDKPTQEWVNGVVDKLVIISNELSGHKFRGYQEPLARRIFESLIIGDAEIITALFSRQSGKSDTVASVVATVMVMFPRLAVMYPRMMGRFREGVKVGAFAPVDEQADTLFGRIVERLTSDRAEKIFADPDINERVSARGRVIKLTRCKSECRKTTAHPRAQIEGRTYHLILIDECFPAGTPVLTSEGWVPIDEIVNGKRRDWMVATQGADDKVEWAPVKTAFKTRRHNELVRVAHENGTLYATANHPFMVGGKEVPAVRLRAGANLSLVQAASESSQSNVETMPSLDSCGVLQFAQSATKKCHGECRCAQEDVADTEENRPSPYAPWGQWDGSYSATSCAAESSWVAVVPRICSANWATSEGRPSDTLQAGPSKPTEENCCGDRRGVALHTEAPRGGQAQGSVVAQSRVVSVEVLKPGSPEFVQFSDSADYVYTLEIDHPSHTYFAAGVLVGNCQGADNGVVNNSIMPMATETRGTKVFTGTPGYTKNVFYTKIQENKRRSTKRGRKRQDHFQYDWKDVSKYSKDYEFSARKEMLRLGEDSDEFRRMYCNAWLLEKGMYTTAERLDQLGDISMQRTVNAWHKTPVVVGIDCGRKQDRTIVTVVYVDWDHPDRFGIYTHRILDWLDLEGMDWENQYHRIVEFLNNYKIWKIGVDTNGLGDVVVDRLRHMMPNVEIVDLGAAVSEQSKRWKHLRQLLDLGRISWPAGSKVKQLRRWRRFYQEMTDLEIDYRGPNVLGQAPKENDAHDDYPDSLSMACILTTEESQETVEVTSNPFYQRGHRH